MLNENKSEMETCVKTSKVSQGQGQGQCYDAIKLHVSSSHRFIGESFGERLTVLEPRDRRLGCAGRLTRESEITVGVQHNVVDVWFPLDPSQNTLHVHTRRHSHVCLPCSHTHTHMQRALISNMTQTPCIAVKFSASCHITDMSPVCANSTYCTHDKSYTQK